MLEAGLEEFFRGPKAPRRKSIRFNQVLQCALDRFIVIYDCDELVALVVAHATTLSPRSMGSNHTFGRRNKTLVNALGEDLFGRPPRQAGVGQQQLVVNLELVGHSY